MKVMFALLSALLFWWGAQAAWYWPFGSDDDEADPPRLSELMEKASELIDEATDLAADGKTNEAADKYNEALAELDRLEREYPERAATDEFATVRTKRSYVTVALDSMLIKDVVDNANAVALTDTTELERKVAELRASRKRARQEAIRSSETEGKPDPASADRDLPKIENQLKEFVAAERAKKKEVHKAAARSRSKRDAETRLQEMLKDEPDNRKARLALIGERLKKSEYSAALADIERLLEEDPSDAAALNLKAVSEMLSGDAKAAEATLN